MDRDEAGLKDLAGRFDDGQVEQVPADLSDLDSIAELPTDIDILVNNAGLQHMSPMRKFPLAEVAELAMFLCGPASASVTGASFAIDGGWTAH